MSKTIETLITCQGQVLQDFWDSQLPFQTIIGPLGSSKTTTTILKIIDMMSQQKPDKDGIRKSRVAAIRNTYSMLHTTTIKDWLEITEDFGTKWVGGGATPPTHTLNFMLEDGTEVQSEMLFLAFDRPDDVKKIRGLQLTFFWANEIKELDKAVIDMMTLRVGRYPPLSSGIPPSPIKMISDCNAPDDDHWLYKLAEEERPPEWGVFKQPGGVIKNTKTEKWEINPLAENLKNLPADYYSLGVVGKDEDWIKVNLANEYGFVIDGKPVHPKYVDNVHCLDLEFKPDPSKNIVLGFDFGRTPACSMMQENSFGSWIVFDEFVCDGNMSAASFAPALSKYLKSQYATFTFSGWGDPSGGKGGQANDDTPIKILVANGIPCEATEESNNVDNRRTALEKPLTEMAMDGKPRLIILPQCKMIRKGLAGGFCFKRVQVSGTARYADKPDKTIYSHVVEALEYSLLGSGEGNATLDGLDAQPEDSWDYDINNGEWM